MGLQPFFTFVAAALEAKTGSSDGKASLIAHKRVCIGCLKPTGTSTAGTAGLCVTRQLACYNAAADRLVRAGLLNAQHVWCSMCTRKCGMLA